MLNVGRLRVLREVAERGSMSAAAEALSFSQPAVSHQIAKLEQETGTQLIERVPRGVRLTEAGELLVHHAEGVLARLDRAESELRDLVSLRRGRLRVGAFPSSFVHLASESIAELRERYPGVEVTVSEVGLEDGGAQVEAGELDIVVAFDYEIAPAGTDGALRRTPLLDDPMYLILPRDHPAANRPKLRLRDLRDESWIQVTQGPASRAIYRTFSSAGFEPRVIFETDDLFTIQGLVAAGLGASLVPGMSLPTMRRDLVVRSLGDAGPRRRVFALTPADGGRSPSTAPMLSILEEEAASLRRQLDELVRHRSLPAAVRLDSPG
jgi:DNA-binding transcriptional LysR family regulator